MTYNIGISIRRPFELDEEDFEGLDTMQIYEEIRTCFEEQIWEGI